MRAGLLRHRVTIQQRTESQGGTGEVTWTWADLSTVWAAIEPVSEREYFAAAQVQSEAVTRIRMRYRDDIRPKMRVKFGARYFDIQGVRQAFGEFKELHLMCVERDADGWRT